MTIVTIKDAEKIAKRTKSEGVIILTFDRVGPGGRIASVSYGKDRLRCNIMGRLLTKIVEALERGEIVP